jgi:hypothetical protein
VAEELLHRADVGAVLEQMRGEGMAKGVTGGALGQARLLTARCGAAARL